MSIYAKLIKVQNELKAPKGQTNKFGGYQYRSAEDILEAVKPVLLENGLAMFISDNLEMVGNRYYVKAIVTVIDIESGEIVQNTAFAREEESKKGCDGSQVTGASSSYSRKYALNGMFAIDDTKDSDATNDYTPELSDKQLNRLYAIAKKAGVTEKQLLAGAVRDYKVKALKELKKADYDALCTRLEGLPAK